MRVSEIWVERREENSLCEETGAHFLLNTTKFSKIKFYHFQKPKTDKRVKNLCSGFKAGMLSVRARCTHIVSAF
jgi:hypothetical protein